MRRVTIALILVFLLPACSPRTMTVATLPEYVTATETIVVTSGSLAPIGTWSYSNVSDAETMTTVAISGLDYLILSFDTGANSRLYIYDASNPISPKIVSSITYPDPAQKVVVRDVVIKDGILYAGLFSDKGMWILDISNPSSPKDMGIVPIPIGDNMLISGNILYGSGMPSPDGIVVCDISDPVHVVEKSRIVPPLKNFGYCPLAASGQYLFAGDENTILVYDLSSPENPKKIADYTLEVPAGLVTEWGSNHQVFNTVADISDMEADGNFLYVAFAAGQVKVIDIANPSSPRALSTADTGGSARILAVDDNLLYVINWHYDTLMKVLAVVDVTHPENPILLGKELTESHLGLYWAYEYARPQAIGSSIYIGGRHHLKIFRVN